MVAHDLRVNPDLARAADGRWLDPPGPAIRDLTAARLDMFDVGRARPGGQSSRAHPRQAAVDGQRIPTLDAVLALAARHGRVRLDLELKTDPERPDVSADPHRLAEAALAAADAAGIANRVVLRSFDWRGLRHAARLRRGLPLAYLSDRADDAALDAVLAEAAGAPAVWAPGFQALTPALLARAQRCGIAVRPWTVNRADDMARLIAWGVDGICTDDPDIARAVMQAAGLPLPHGRAGR